MYRSVLAALLLLTGGCVGLSLSDTLKAVEKAKTVGVISAVGHKFAVQKIGIMVFGNELNEAPIESWGIDDAVTARVSVLLSKRFTVRRIAYPKGAFAAYDKPTNRDHREELRDIIRRIAASQTCDLYLVVTGAGAQFGTTNQFVSGLGMVEYAGGNNVHLFAVAAVHLFDGRTFQLLHTMPMRSDTAYFGEPIGGPGRKLDATWWPASVQAVQRNEKLRAATQAVLEEGLAATIPDLMGTRKE